MQVLGVGIALMFLWSRISSLTLLFVTRNIVLKIAFGPLIVVWLGYGLGPNIVITFAISFFPVLLNTLRGLDEVEPDLLDLVRALEGSVQLPASLPYIFSGMKVAGDSGHRRRSGQGIHRFRAWPRLPHGSGPDVPRYAMFMAVVLLTLMGAAVYLITIDDASLRMPDCGSRHAALECS